MANDMVRTNVAAIELSAGGLKMRTVAEVYGFCELIGRAGMLPKGVSLEGAVVSVLAGARLGLDPFQAVQGIAVVNGRPALWGDAMLAVVKGSGLLEDEQVEYLPSRKECAGVRYTCKRKGTRSPYIGTFSRTDAERAGLWGKPGPWSQYPERMLLSRARAFALRDGFADVLRGIACREEVEDTIVDAPAPAPSVPPPNEPPAKPTEAPAAQGDEPGKAPELF